jgi:hypothetical protein
MEPNAEPQLPTIADADLDHATGGNWMQTVQSWFQPDPSRVYTPNARCQAAPWLPQCQARAQQERQRVESLDKGTANPAP